MTFDAEKFAMEECTARFGATEAEIIAWRRMARVAQGRLRWTTIAGIGCLVMGLWLLAL